MMGVSQISDAKAKPKKSTKERSRTTKYKSMSPAKWLKFRKFYETSEFSLLVCCRIHEVNYRTAQSRSKAEGGWVKQVEQKRIQPITGTPDTYRPEYAKKIVEYFSSEEPYREITTAGNRIQLVPNKIKTIAGFAAEIGVHRQTLWVWANQRNDDGYINPDFRYAFFHAMSHAEHNTLCLALSGAGNPAMAALVLRNHFYYKTEKDEPVDNASSRQDANELDSIYSTALESVKTLQDSTVGTYEEITGQRDPNTSFYRGNPDLIEAEYTDEPRQEIEPEPVKSEYDSFFDD